MTAAVITRRFPTLFFRQNARALLRHPVLLALNILSIALGVAVFLAIQMANRGASASFRAGIDLVAGRANLEIRGNLDENLLPKIAALDGVRAATPLVEGVVTFPKHPGEYLRVIGVDPFSGDELRTFELLNVDRDRLDLETWLRDPDAIAVTPDFTRKVLPKVGPALEVLAGAASRTLRPRFVIQPAASSGDPRIAAMDIGWAQELLDSRGRLSAILLLVEPARLDAVTAQIRRLVPADARIESPSQRGRQIEAMLGAFQLNLTALSLVSVLVGAFLIYNALSASVVRRRREIGILRATGATRGEVRLLFLGEAAVAGIVGTMAGILLAVPLASVLSAPVAQTVRNLYILTSIEGLALSPGQIAEALAVGLVTAIVAAWLPADEAARMPPAAALRPDVTATTRQPRPSRRWTITGLALLAAAALFGAITLRFHLPALGFLSAFAVLAGFSLLASRLIYAATSALRRAPRHLRLAAANLAQSRHRNAVTVAALAAAIAMTVSVSVMIHSFRASVNDWIDATLQDDLFIGLAANEAGPAASALPAAVVPWLRQQPGVAHLATRADQVIHFREERTDFAIITGERPFSLRFIGDAGKAFREFAQPGAVAVSEPFARRFRVERGDRIELLLPAGRVMFRVAGVFQDYARNGGLVIMKRADYERHGGAFRPQAAAVTLANGESLDRFTERFRERFDDAGQFSVYSNRALRARIFEIFNETFTVTLVLRAIAIAVAAAGVTLALLILATERTREIGVLRAIGASRIQVMGLFLREAGLLGLIASALGTVSGAALAMVLTWVVNKAFFGWTIPLSYPAGLLLATPFWIVPVAILAAVLPAWRAAGIPPATAVRFE